MKKDRAKRFVLRYTWMFACVAAAVLSVFLVNGRSLIRGLDGPAQHYAALRYLGDWIRAGLSGVGWKMIDFSLGQGMDVLTTLSYYCFTEPLAFVSALVPAEYTEYLYAALLFVRFYLAGLFAGMLARQHGAKGWTAAVGGLLYGCGSFMAAGGLWHFNFGIGLVFLPLMLLAVERVFRTGRWHAYVAVVALQLVSSFYFAYMNTVIAVLYILARLAQEMTSRREIARSARVGGKLLGGYLLGAGVAAAVFLPVAMAYLGGGRGALETGAGKSLLFYPVSFYKELLTGFFGCVSMPGTWTLVGYAPLAALGASMFVLKKERSTSAVRGMLCLCALMLCVPAVGKVMNGMGYASNRWCYAFELFLMLAAVRGIDDVAAENRWKVFVLCGIWMAYGLGCFVVKRTVVSAVVVLLFAGAAAIFAARAAGRLKEWNFRAAVCALAVISLSASTVLSYAQVGDGLVKNYLSWGYVESDQSERLSAFEDSAEDGFYRVDGAFLTEDDYKGYIGGHAPMLNYRGVSYYWSITPSVVSDHYVDTWSNSLIYYHLLHGMGGDAGMNQLASVRYVLAAEECADVIPQGYEAVESFVGEDGLHYTVYESRAYPLGYTFDSWMSEEEYKKLSAMEKRDALLHTAVVETAVEGLAEADYVPSVQKLSSSIEVNRLEDGMKISCTVPERGEIFIAVAAPEMAGSAECFDISGPAGSNRAYISDPGSNFAYPQQGVILPMGVVEAGEAEFTFHMDSEFDCAGVEIWHRPDVAFIAAQWQMAESSLSDVEIGVNRVSGLIDAWDESKWLQLSIPYSEGWTAKVDGKPVELSRSGGMYMGLLLERGSNCVELEYFTPWLKEGLIISLMSCLWWIAISFADSARRRRKAEK